MAAPASASTLLDPARLQSLGASHAAGYQSADPFPHAVIDDFVGPDVVAAIVAEYPRNREEWDLYLDEGNSNKLAISDEARLGPTARRLIAELNGGAMIRFLEAMTGITGLVADPHLLGGGLHQLDPGGFLRVHADFNHHPHLKLDRRLNFLLYLNDGWIAEWGGSLELWNADMTQRSVSVVPVAGRAVVFSTTSTSYHGNPEPVACPEGMARRSIALYYYTNGRPEEERSVAHNTLYQTPGAGPAGPPAPGSVGRRGLRGRLRGR
jgi:Rps23 Pro-64 3,4-dihydroxylase Tpa1-like proline 4-hydroxylase